MARRRFQHGQLTLDQYDRWIVRYYERILDASTGKEKAIRRKVIIGTKKDMPRRMAERELADILKPINALDYRPAVRETLANFAMRWQSTVMVQHKPSSQASERSVIKNQILPAFGECLLRDISPEMIQQYVSARKTSAKTTQNVIKVFRAMWATAKGWGYVQHDPFIGLRYPHHVAGNTYHFTVEEALAIIDKAQGTDKLILRILAETGMRPGELAGLRPEDIGLRSIRIVQSVWGRKLQAPKTKNAIRTVAISRGLAEQLREHIRHLKPNKDNLMFISKRGGPLDMANFGFWTFGPILKELGIRAKLDSLGIKACGVYAFRHMSATLMDEFGVPLKTRQARLGHANPDVTIRNYTHSTDAADVEFADKVGLLFEQKQEGAIQ